MGAFIGAMTFFRDAGLAITSPGLEKQEQGNVLQVRSDKCVAGCREVSVSIATGLKTIVVATDLDGRSEAALEYARKLASAYGARIVLAHGLDPMDYAAVDSVPGRVLKGMPEQARAALEKMAADLILEGIHSHSEIRQGAVAQMLVDVARQYQAGLIVIGTEGKQGAGPVVVGAVAEQLVRLAPCAVMAVAADWNAGSFRPTPGGPILLAVEKNEAMPAAVATALSLAEVFRRTLIVLHARSAAEAVGFEPGRNDAGGVWHSGAWAISGTLHRQGRPACGSNRQRDRSVSSKRTGGWGKARERDSWSSWHSFFIAGGVAGAGVVCAAGHCTHKRRAGNLYSRSYKIVRVAPRSGQARRGVGPWQVEVEFLRRFRFWGLAVAC